MLSLAALLVVIFKKAVLILMLLISVGQDKPMLLITLYSCGDWNNILAEVNQQNCSDSLWPKKHVGLLLVYFSLKDRRDTLAEDILAHPQESLNNIHSNRNLETRVWVEEQSIILLTALHLLAIVCATTG